MFHLATMNTRHSKKKTLRIFLTVGRKGTDQLAFSVFFDQQPVNIHLEAAKAAMTQATDILCKRAQDMSDADKKTENGMIFNRLTKSLVGHRCMLEACAESEKIGYRMLENMYLGCRGDMPGGTFKCKDRTGWGAFYIYEVTNETVTTASEKHCSSYKNVTQWWENNRRKQRNGMVTRNLNIPCQLASTHPPMKVTMTSAVVTRTQGGDLAVVFAVENSDHPQVVITEKKIHSMHILRGVLASANEKRQAPSTDETSPQNPSKRKRSVSPRRSKAQQKQVKQTTQQTK